MASPTLHNKGVAKTSRLSDGFRPAVPSDATLLSYSGARLSPGDRSGTLGHQLPRDNACVPSLLVPFLHL